MTTCVKIIYTYWSFRKYIVIRVNKHFPRDPFSVGNHTGLRFNMLTRRQCISLVWTPLRRDAILYNFLQIQNIVYKLKKISITSLNFGIDILKRFIHDINPFFYNNTFLFNLRLAIWKSILMLFGLVKYVRFINQVLYIIIMIIILF